MVVSIGYKDNKDKPFSLRFLLIAGKLFSAFLIAEIKMSDPVKQERLSPTGVPSGFFV